MQADIKAAVYETAMTGTVTYRHYLTLRNDVQNFLFLSYRKDEVIDSNVIVNLRTNADRHDGLQGLLSADLRRERRIKA